jgi:alkanesulfonate monooxygenase SsuD/methylene tetrahydromethanopterin reductase-like flavin-dependent oxidoreductase (luciferase family)
MSGARIGVALPGCDAATAVSVAEAAEAANLDLVVIGDVAGAAPNADDSYVLTTAGAVAMRTAHLRLALALDLRGSAPLLRATEDIGVLDVLSAGRIELLMRPGADEAWRRELDQLLDGWRAWPLPDGSAVPTTPSPVQPEIPVWLVDGSAAAALRGGAGVVFVAWPGEIPDAATMGGIRRRRDEAGAATVVFDVAGVAAEERPAAIRALGGVAGPCLRCPDDEVGILALDSTEYLLHREELHEPPLP